MLGGENMCIDDNIPADNYCGIILKAEQQEDTDIYGNVKWRRIYLWVDIAKGLYKGYFSNRYTITGRKEWQGVMSLYMPTTDNCSSTDDVTTYQRYKKKIDIIMQYNKLDKVPTLLAGLLVPIQIYRDDIGATKIKNYCCSYNYQIDTTFADADISHYAQIDDIQYYSPRANLSNALMPTIVSNNSISPARSIAERRRQRASQSLQPTNIPPILASPPASPAPQLIVSAVSAKQAVSILQSLYSNDKLIDLYKRYLATNFLPPAPTKDTNSLEILYNRLNAEFCEVCFTSATSLQSCDIGKYDRPLCNQQQYADYMEFTDTLEKLIGEPTGQYCRLYKYLSAYYYRYFAHYNFAFVTDKQIDNVIDANADKTAYNLQKDFRRLMFDVIYPNSAITPLWIVDDISIADYLHNWYGLCIDEETEKIRFRADEEVFGMVGHKGVDKKTGLSMYRRS